MQSSFSGFGEYAERLAVVQRGAIAQASARAEQNGISSNV
jgi:hypothetical protein